jgi:hypothetical protein
MMRVGLAFTLLASLAFAQNGPAPGSGRMQRGNLLKINDYRTAGTATTDTYFVNATGGSDTFNCTSASTPCATVQGALNKIPKLLRNGVTVSVAAGTYGGFYVAGFTCDPGLQQTTGGLLIDGFSAFTNSTLATGTPTGTATASSAGSGSTFGTLTDGAQTWTVDDLKGRFVTAAGQTRVISSNTATAITIVGTWTNPGNVAYTIQDPGVIINAAVPALPTGLLAAGATTGAAIMVFENSCYQRSGSITVRGLRTTNTSGAGIIYGDVGGGQFTLLQLRSSGASVAGIQQGGSSLSNSIGAAPGGLQVSDVDGVSSSANGYFAFQGASVTNSVQRVLVRGGSRGIDLRFGHTSLTGVDLQGQTQYGIAVASGFPGWASITGSRIDCASNAVNGILMGSATAGINGSPGSALVTTTNVTTCSTGIIIGGAGVSAELASLTGSVVTGINALIGSSVTFSSSGTTITGSSQDISLDSGAVTAALADVTAGTCLQNASTNSKVCAR